MASAFRVRHAARANHGRDMKRDKAELRHIQVATDPDGPPPGITMEESRQSENLLAFISRGSAIDFSMAGLLHLAE